MPSPIGHALGAVAAGWLVGGRVWPGWHATAFIPRLRPITDALGPKRRAYDLNLTNRAMAAVLYATVGIAPDLDLLVGAHSTYTHSIGAVGIVFLVACALSKRPRVAAAIAAAWASHLLLDWLGNDTSPPIGIMALWPFSGEHYESSFYVFDAISRRYWLTEHFVWSNLRAALKEVLILGPVAGVSYWVTSVNHRATKNTENARSS
jgi:membrane-bound metal-dependent hydrolase YbcI (DUF457 family)